MKAMIAWADFNKLKSADTSVSQMLNEEYQKLVSENRHYIKTVAEILLLTAKQDIAQRGHIGRMLKVATKVTFVKFLT